MSADIIQWKPCLGFPDYEVSEFGDVRRCAPDALNRSFGRPLKGSVRQGYKRFKLSRDRKIFNILAHRLVGEAFIGPKPFDKAEVCHNDGVKLNLHYTNLRWDTHKSNHLDRIEHGSSNRGAKNGKARLTAEQVIDIRSRVAKGEMQRDIAKEFGVAGPTISMIVTRVNWGHLA